MRARALVLGLAVGLLLSGCAASDGAARKHPAATTMTQLLELRAENTSDAAAYEPFFADPEVASSLVGGSAAETGTPAVPSWEPPYVSKLTSDTAEVVVRWTGRTGTFESWPEATIFVMTAAGPRWVVSDAIEPDGDVPGALSAREIDRF